MAENTDAKNIKNENIHKGHRAKVRNRYYENGFNGMADHNVLEMLLFFGIPYKDTNELAHELINRFCSFSGVLEADPKELLAVKGMTENAACLISMVLPLYKRYIQDVTGRKPFNESKKSLAEYIRSLYLDTTDEKIFAFAYDHRRCFLGYRSIGEGDIASSSVDMRRLASFVLETKASSVIIAHNHPHGITSPSADDIEATKAIYKFLHALNVRLYDHIIVNATDYFSLADSMKFAYIFTGMEKSPYSSDIDRKIEEAEAFIAEKKREEDIDRVRRIAEEAARKRKEKMNT